LWSERERTLVQNTEQLHMYMTIIRM